MKLCFCEIFVLNCVIVRMNGELEFVSFGGMDGVCVWCCGCKKFYVFDF